MSEATAGSIETASELGLSSKDVSRRWLLEIQLASKAEDKFRKQADKIYKRYRGDGRKNSVNILWANTEILRPTCYNSTPKPDVRRRYRDADPLGKAVSECLTRALDFSCKTYDIDTPIKLDVLDTLLPGRGVSRIRYVPSLQQVGDTQETGREADETQTDHESQEGSAEELTWEQVICEHVNWSDFRHGPGRTWNEVLWLAFKHRLNREQCIKLFGGDIGNQTGLEDAEDEAVRKMEKSDPVKGLFATGEFWEVWDKESRKVYFVSEGYSGVCKQEDDPLGLQDFFPVPRPLYAIEDSDSLIPTAMFSQYEEQADELNDLSRRYNKIIEALKLRGVYDATITEMAQVMRANDNDLIPAKNVGAFMDRGGLDKMVWWWPIEHAAAVLVELQNAIIACVARIYELTGLSDVIRSATDPNETATAQEYKVQFGTMRIQRLQKEVGRYARDLIRLKGEVISNKFNVETLQQMTELPFLTEQQVQQFQAQQQMAAQQAQMQGQPPQPPQPMPITWAQVMQALRNKAMRSYHVDIETDSTIAEQLQGDMQGLQEVLAGVTNFIKEAVPALQAQMLPIDAVKEVVMTICRRAKLGNAVEDAFDKMQQPQAPPDPNQGKAQIELQKIQAQQQAANQDRQQQAQFDQMKLQQEKELEQFRQQMQAAQVQHQNQLEAQREQLQQHNEAQLRQMEAANEERIEGMRSQVQILMANLNNAARIEVAEIGAQTTLQTAQISAAKSAESGAA